MAAGAIFNFEDPCVRIELDFAHDPLFDLGFRSRTGRNAASKRTVAGMRLLESGLRRRPEQFGSSVQPVELDENRSCLFGAAPAHGRESPLAVAATQVGGYPDRRLEP